VKQRRDAEQRSERDRLVGVDPDDAAGRWLQEHDPPAEPPSPKRPLKSKALHRFRQQQQRRGR
jgi:hypothetical protein